LSKISQLLDNLVEASRPEDVEKLVLELILIARTDMDTVIKTAVSKVTANEFDASKWSTLALSMINILGFSEKPGVILKALVDYDENNGAYLNNFGVFMETSKQVGQAIEYYSRAYAADYKAHGHEKASGFPAWTNLHRIASELKAVSHPSYSDPRKFFIIYKKGTAKSLAEHIHDELENTYHMNVFLDVRDIEEGLPPSTPEWKEQRDRALVESQVFLFIVTAGASKSKEVSYELEKAMQYRKNIKAFIHEDIWDAPTELVFTVNGEELNIKKTQVAKFKIEDDLLRKVIRSTILLPLKKRKNSVRARARAQVVN